MSDHGLDGLPRLHAYKFTDDSECLFRDEPRVRLGVSVIYFCTCGERLEAGATADDSDDRGSVYADLVRTSGERARIWWSKHCQES